MKRFSLENIRKAMIAKKIDTQKELRVKTGLGVSTMQRVFNGEAKPAAKTVDALARVLGLSHAELFGEDAPAAPVAMDLEKTVYIEIKGKVWATPFRYSMQRGLGQFLRGNPGEQDCFALQVEGDSMMPLYVAGDLVICRPVRVELTPYNESDDAPVYVPYEQIARYNNRDAIVEHNGETNLKRIQIERKSGPKYDIFMTSLNQKYDRNKVHFGDEWAVKAVVIRVHKPEITE